MVYQVRASARNSDFGDLHPLLRQLLNPGTTVQLYRRKAWIALLRTWPRLHQQHDVAELLTYIVDHANVPGLKGIREARSMEGPLLRAHQRMQPVPLITLPCKPNKTLQQLIEDWAYEQDTGEGSLVGTSEGKWESSRTVYHLPLVCRYLHSPMASQPPSSTMSDARLTQATTDRWE